MDYYVNSKIEEDTIYEIYKSCRLCGAGAGYKMPIIQNVINLDPDETELKQKIRECVQIEVHQDDKMPPLVCELCVDKVNDFYEFLEMCRQTNKKTRLRLGLPPQTLPRGAPDAGDCILGVTEPVFINENSSNHPNLSRSSKNHKTVKIKKDPEPKVNTKFRKKDDPKTLKLAESKKNDSKITRLSESKKDDPKITRSSESKKDDYKITRSSESKKEDSKIPRAAESSSLRSGRSRQPSPPPPSPPRALRGTKRPSGDSVLSNKIQNTNKPETPPTKSILKKIKVEIADDLLEPRSKRPRDCLRETTDTPKREQNKKVKVTLNVPKVKIEAMPVRPSPPPPSHKCHKCKNVFKTPQALTSHMNTHNKVEKVEKLKPLPPPKPEPKPKLQKCTKCDKTFPASTFKGHKCAPKREPECRICKRKFNNTGACINHEKACKSPANTSNQRKAKIPQWLKSQLLPMEVRLMRCDPLCDDNGRCRDASFVDHDYGLDKRCEYPYLYNLSMLTHKLRIKSELAMYDRMVKIQDEIRDEFDLDECYTHWDSASESDSDTEIYKSKSKNDVKPLSTLSLKVLFSPKGLGKVPKKLRKVKSEKPFDSILNSTELDSDIKFGINNIINSLEDSINENDNSKDFINDKYKTKDEDALFGENKGPGVKNTDFDSLFGNAGNADCNKNKLSSHEDVERKPSPTLDLSDVDSRLSRSNENTVSNLGDGNSSSISYTKNAIKKIQENDSDKSENESVDRISSSQASVIVSSSMTLNNEVEGNIIAEKVVESKEDYVKENREDKEHPIFNNDNINSNSALSTMVERSTEDKEKRKENNEKSKESLADKKIEDKNIQNQVTETTKNSSHESEIIDNSKRSDYESVNNAQVPKENTPQKEVYSEQSKNNTNGKLPEKLNMDDLEAVSDTDMDDGKLMEAIDAQLGESENGKPIVTNNLSSKVNQESDDFTKDIEF